MDDIDSKHIGAVLFFDSPGSRGPHNQTIGADGSGEKCVIFLGEVEEAHSKALQYLKDYQGYLGRRVKTCFIVRNEEGVSGQPVTIRKEERNI